MNKYSENKNKKKPNNWIIKPGQFSNRGQGISCTSKIDDIKMRVNALKKSNKKQSLIIQ